MTLWIVIIVLKPPVQWGHSLPNPLFTKSPSTIERFRIPLQSKRFLILFDYIFLHTTKTFHFYLIWIRLEGYYIFKVFKDLPDFCYSKFLQAVQRNETDNFQFFLFAKVSHNQPLFDVDSSAQPQHLTWQVSQQEHLVRHQEEEHFYKNTHTHSMILLWISRVKKVEMSKFGLHFESKKKLHIKFTVLLAKASICRGAKF